MPVREPHTNVTVSESVTKIDVDNSSGEISLDISPDQTILQLRGIAISESNASQIAVQPSRNCNCNKFTRRSTTTSRPKF